MDMVQYSGRLFGHDFYAGNAENGKINMLFYGMNTREEGDRIVDLNPVEFMTVVKEGFKFLESKERCLTCGRKYDDDL